MSQEENLQSVVQDGDYDAYVAAHPEPMKAINWNEIPDEKDLEVWDRLTGNF